VLIRPSTHGTNRAKQVTAPLNSDISQPQPKEQGVQIIHSPQSVGSETSSRINARETTHFIEEVMTINKIMEKESTLQHIGRDSNLSQISSAIVTESRGLTVIR
jgi:hypothetical protein